MKFILLRLLVLELGLCLASNYDFYRLPTALRPQKYNLSILTHLDNPEDHRFEGTVKIELLALENTKNITLHSKNLTIDESQIALRQINGGETDNCISSTAVNPTYDFYILHTCQELVVGNTYELSLSFSADLNRRLEGYYRSSYRDVETNETRWISVTQFEPTSARLAFPCFDEPAFKATFAITLGYHKRFSAISNMPEKEIKEHKTLPHYLWCEFEESVPMSTYLVAYSVNDFSSKPSTQKEGTLFRTWARRNAIDQCDFAADFGPKVLEYYEELLGIKFPLPKIDHIAVPDFSEGAMENWGLVVYTESDLLSSSGRSSLLEKQRVASVMAHELAHQWFGNLVTMKWWTDLWLKEGIATYVATLALEHIHPEWRSRNQDYFSNMLPVFQGDALVSTHPLSRPISEESQIIESFDEISYEKGATVLGMMHFFLGDESFRSGLQSYLQFYSYKNADQDNLWESLTQAAHKFGVLPSNYDIKTIMDSWTLQAGYPVINVTRDSEIPPSSSTGCWWVPLSYTTQEEQDFNITKPKAWMECGKSGEDLPKTIQDLPGANQWVIFNTQLISLYKVNYDSQNWNLLIEALTKGDFQSIHVINRAQLIDDALYLAWTGEQDYGLALRLIGYLQREKEYLPWKSVDENLRRVDRIIRQTPNFGLFKRYLGKLIKPIYEHLQGINDTFSSIQEQDQVLLKTLVINLACQYQVSDCVPQALAYYRNWRSLANPDALNPIPSNIRATVYCIAIKYGGDGNWAFLWRRYQNSDLAAEKYVMLWALGCSRQVWQLERYLELIFDSNEIIRKKDSLLAFEAVASTELGCLLARKYLMDNIDSLYQFYYRQASDMSRLLYAICDQVISRSDLNKFKDFVTNSGKSLEGLDQAIQLNLEIMLVNVQWRERNLNQMSLSMQDLL
ncbi:hypothetical protein KR009_004925 [Drosophila setifemur]|nr:hypothetical protein KR009_004925 [Drosophila setifemur]